MTALKRFRFVEEAAMIQCTKFDLVRPSRVLRAMFGVIAVLAEAALAADQTRVIGGPGGCFRG
jgi:hypothetical protein